MLKRLFSGPGSADALNNVYVRGLFQLVWLFNEPFKFVFLLALGIRCFRPSFLNLVIYEIATYKRPV